MNLLTYFKTVLSVKQFISLPMAGSMILTRLEGDLAETMYGC